MSLEFSSAPYWNNLTTQEIHALGQLISRIGMYDENSSSRMMTVRGLVMSIENEEKRRYRSEDRHNLEIIANACSGIGGTDARMAVLAKAILRLEDSK